MCWKISVDFTIGQIRVTRGYYRGMMGSPKTKRSRRSVPLPEALRPVLMRHFLEVLYTLNHLGIEFVSFRENPDTGGPLGRAVVVIVSAVAELERNCNY